MSGAPPAAKADAPMTAPIAYNILSSSHILAVLDDTDAARIRTLLDALRATAAGASSDVRREVHFHAFTALRKTGHAAAWAAELDAALDVHYERPAPPGPPRQPRRSAEDDPSLRLWWRELERGVRTVRTFDSLWEAACWESSARDLGAQGSVETAARCRETAATIIVEAASAKRRRSA